MNKVFDWNVFPVISLKGVNLFFNSARSLFHQKTTRISNLIFKIRKSKPSNKRNKKEETTCGAKEL